MDSAKILTCSRPQTKASARLQRSRLRWLRRRFAELDVGAKDVPLKIFDQIRGGMNCGKLDTLLYQTNARCYDEDVRDNYRYF